MPYCLEALPPLTMFAPKLNHPMMPERKSATLNIQAGTSMQITPGLLSSDEVVRAISSRVQYAVVSGLSGQIGVTGAVTVNLVDGATGQVLKTVSSLSNDIRSDRTLPVALLQFVNTPFGSTILNVILTGAVAVGILLYQEHSQEQSEARREQAEAERQSRTEQVIRQMAQSVERDFLSHREQATPTPPPTPPQGD
jgi:hypothetical protein